MKKNSLLGTYAILNLFILLPIVLFTAIIYANAYYKVKNEMISLQSAALCQAMQSIDGTLESFTVMSTYAHTDPELSPYELRQGRYSSTVALRRLGLHTAPANLENVYIYIDSQGMLYSPSGAISLAYFTELYSFDGAWDRDGFTELLQGDMLRSISPADCTISKKSVREEKYTIMIAPWRNGGARYGAFVGLIEADYFRGLLADAVISADGIGLVYDGGGTLLYQTGGEFDAGGLYEAVGESPESGELRCGQGSYYLIRQESPVNGWQYLALVPKKQIAASLLTENTVLFFVIVLVSVFSLVSGLLLTSHFSRPIRSIWETLLEQPSPNIFKAGPAHAAEIGAHVSDLVKSNQTMTHELDESKEHLRAKILSRLLEGSFHSAEDCVAELGRLGVVMAGPYQVLAIESGGLPIVRQNAVYRQVVEMGCHVVETLHAGGMAVILHGPSDGFEGDIARLTQLLKAQGDGHFQIGIGQAYDAPSMIQVSHVEALAAAVSKTDAVAVRFEEAYEAYSNTVEWYPHKEQIRLAETVQQGNVNAVARNVGEIRRHLSAIEPGVDHRQLRFAVYSIIHDLLPVMDRAWLQITQWEINRLLHYGSINDFTEKLGELCNKVASAYHDHRRLTQNRLLGDILSYIDDRYCEQGISLTKIAERFNLTDSTLSRLFSEHYDMRFIDYVSNKRLEKAAGLLRESGLSIREIVERIGYIDVSSFTRKFTQRYGISPGKYRKSGPAPCEQPEASAYSGKK